MSPDNLILARALANIDGDAYLSVYTYVHEIAWWRKQMPIGTSPALRFVLRRFNLTETKAVHTNLISSLGTFLLVLAFVCAWACLIAYRFRRKRKELLDSVATRLQEAIEEQNRLLDADCYLMKKDWDSLVESHKSLYREVMAISKNERDACGLGQLIEAFVSRQANKTIREERNNQFKKRELMRCNVMFSEIDGKSLDAQQRDAIVTDEYNNLIIAGAGSGKTLTVVGKVKYLVQRRGINPGEILVTSFTQKSVNELQERLEKAGLAGVNCRTSHSLGLRQLSGIGVANENELSNCVREYLREGIHEHPEQMRAYLEFYGYCQYILKPYSEYGDAGTRYEEYRASDLETIKSKLGAIRRERAEVSLDTRKGERVKSFEELMIANYLCAHGIRYEYEKVYTGEYEARSRAYQPDFYLVDYDIWLEHFGIDENGRLPWIKNPIREKEYIDSIAWKRNVHKDNGTVLIESYSYWNKDQNLLNKLETLLKEYGVMVDADDEYIADIYRELSADDKYLRSITKLVTTFLSLARANNITMDEVWEKGRTAYSDDGYMWRRFELFMTFVEPVMPKYIERLKTARKTDFDGMINLATEKIKHMGTSENFKYIIVDEYQDISRSRFDLIKAIREANDAKLICVGDDWQAIYRFAGSDVSLFTHFDDYVGYSEHLKIERTYRNSQELVDIASEFIEKNPSQIQKELTSVKHCAAPVVIKQINDAQRGFKHALEEIINAVEDYQGSIYVLGRHNMDLEKLFPKLEGDNDISFCREAGTKDVRINFKGYDNIQFMTVHRAKGLEADDVVVLNLLNDIYGFPNRVEDDPILQILLGVEEKYAFAEERRLFYVALTRTRNTVQLISSDSGSRKAPSPFINELKAGKHADHILITVLENAPDEWNPLYCPSCGSGRLTVRTNHATGKQFLGCSNYPFCGVTYDDIEIINDRVKCPSCGDWMVRRKRDSDGKPFFGCSNFPKCRSCVDCNDEYEPFRRHN
ncbi:AAA family ATPase [Eggerthellaceae bacterium zg-887]|uniref:UvrD-helicase domain-containing protein n=1 Tax=Xiamenia xianingshaonis TaxID=2682776 RepID=UPI00140DDA28|nr:UvrD-helicase domain-containing protein [Xiamenia xianingshaonis]NHM15996.1 AAA family ATPase [Xiamenia xianingshaonis]